MTYHDPDATFSDWPHAPCHLFVPHATYFITAGTYLKQMLFNSPAKRDFLMETLFEEALRWNWRLEAWAILANHYHVVACAPELADSLKSLLNAIHSKTAIWLNKHDAQSGRKCWYRYRDTCLTYQKSYLARLNYTHHNPVKHGVVKDAEDYRWCSLAWFKEQAEPRFRDRVLSLKYDRINVEDDF
jgi:putative transposase